MAVYLPCERRLVPSKNSSDSGSADRKFFAHVGADSEKAIIGKLDRKILSAVHKNGDATVACGRNVPGKAGTYKYVVP